MKEIKLKLWEEFETEIEKLFSFIKGRREELKKNNDPSAIPDYLFRGQSDSNKKLKTTLERIKNKPSCSEYHRIIESSKSHIESLTGAYWDLPPFVESKSTPMPPQAYPFMVYLRHHKFPSPLLDWTRSPYIAAFFAFSDILSQNENKDDANISIFAYLEHLESGKSGWEEAPKIIQLGPNVRTHKRHYLQQSEYTICTKIENGKNYYWNHEEVFDVDHKDQDICIKYTMPISEKPKVLRKLDLMNINAYSLFDYEEALIHTLAVRNFIISDT